MTQSTDTINQKLLAGFLDTAAARSESVDRDPATPKQCWYLAHLILESGEDYGEYITNTSLVLTKHEASHRIGYYREG